MTLQVILPECPQTAIDLDKTECPKKYNSSSRKHNSKCIKNFLVVWVLSILLTCSIYQISILLGKSANDNKGIETYSRPVQSDVLFKISFESQTGDNKDQDIEYRTTHELHQKKLNRYKQDDVFLKRQKTYKETCQLLEKSKESYKVQDVLKHIQERNRRESVLDLSHSTFQANKNDQYEFGRFQSFLKSQPGVMLKPPGQLRSSSAITGISLPEDLDKRSENGVVNFSRWQPINYRFRAWKYSLQEETTEDNKQDQHDEPESHEQDWIFCVPPKTGTTHWQKLLLAAMNKESSPKDISISVGNETQYTYDSISNLADTANIREENELRTTPESEEMLDAAPILESILARDQGTRDNIKKLVKIINVRHPVDRLYSAWKDKMKSIHGPSYGDDSTNYFYNQLLYQSKKSGKESLPNEYKSPPGYKISWPDFVQAWLDTEDENLYNHHWRSTLWTCLPCGYDYDFIVKIETANEDSRKIIDLLFPDLAENEKKFLTIEQSNSARSTDEIDESRGFYYQYKEAWLPENMKNQLRERLQWDLKMFGYEY